ncbi:MAG: CoA-acylating methylmalonate-semialdehyde dehydrogenase [Candidatus Bathyarchaeia archaeon]|jgi:malonate-semialdehyde dehydrogenase (acetylating)/methylmalonate-semialdehyde dehydrogenase
MSEISEVQSNYGRLKFFIGGKWVESNSDHVQPVMNPAKDEPIAEVPFATEDEVNSAVEAARNAFERWSELPVTTRAGYIFRMKQKLEEYFEDIARITTQNHGKIIDEARGETRRLVENVEVGCTTAYTLAKGEHLDQIALGVDETLVREPLGCFGVIGPFNFPSMAPFWFIPIAMAVGCTLVIKPSEVTPLPMQMCVKAIEEAGIPAGVVNMVHGSKEANEILISHPNIKGVSFVGSTAVGKSIYRLAGEKGKRALCQAGAKNYVVVMPDADLSTTIPALLPSFYGNTGQRCLSGSNLVAVGDVYEELRTKFSMTSSKLTLGYGLNESVEMGPLVSRKAKERVLQYIEKGLDEGAKLILDGRNVELQKYPRGYFVGPTIFDQVTSDMTIAKDEIFGPVASIIQTKSLEDALEMINNKTTYGNAACIFTRSGKTAREFRRRAQAGNIGINIGIAAPMAFFPFAGFRSSFFGVVHGQIDCVDFFTDKKVIVTRW